MNPGIVTAAVFVVGAIALALGYVFSEPPQTQSHSYRNRNNDRVYNYNFNTISTNNYYPSDKSSKTENETKNRKKGRQRVSMKNDQCGICLEPLSGDLVILSCEHAYHGKCLEDYSASEKSNGGQLRCPLCRQPID